MSTLATYYDMSFAAVQRHVSVLQAVGLVSKKPRGRERLVHSELEPLIRARTMLTQLEGLWRERGRQLDALFASEAEDAAATATSPESRNPHVH